MSAKIINFELICLRQFTVFVESILNVSEEAYEPTDHYDFRQYGPILSMTAILQTLRLMKNSRLFTTESECIQYLNSNSLILPRDYITLAFN